MLTIVPINIFKRLAKLIVEIAKREFPQQWPNFFEEIVEMHWADNVVSKSKVSSSSSYRMCINYVATFQICLMVFQFLAEDCVDADFNSSLPLKRRDEIIAGMQEGMQPLLTFTYNWLFDILNIYSSSGAGAGTYHFAQ
jgi:hypothetical protein